MRYFNISVDDRLLTACLELRNLIETSQAQIETLTSKCTSLEERAQTAEKDLVTAKADLEKARTFEQQLREKDLLIGKLKHEAVTLNDHLRKAMRVIKRNNSEDKIDKQLVTNLFLQFQSIERGDTKKYQALQVISSVLDWNDEQKEKAGLLRPGTAQSHHSSGGGGLLSSFRSPPLSPFHRSPSTPVLSDAYEVPPDRDVSILPRSFKSFCLTGYRCGRLCLIMKSKRMLACIYRRPKSRFYGRLGGFFPLAPVVIGQCWHDFGALLWFMTYYNMKFNA